MKLLLASNNKHKADEISAIFEKLLPGKIQLILPKDLSDEKIDPIEDGEALVDNAFIKANEFYKRFGIPCIADDTGLEIDALNGEPGVKSARYAGDECNDAANRKKVLEALKGKTGAERTARFKTVFCLIDDDDSTFVGGICPGRIIEEERGEGGFGYDSIFVPDDYDQTFAELPAHVKNEISHRAVASVNLAVILKQLFDL